MSEELKKLLKETEELIVDMFELGLKKKVFVCNCDFGIGLDATGYECQVHDLITRLHKVRTENGNA